MDNEILKIADKAENTYYDYMRACEDVEEALKEKFSDEKDYIEECWFHSAQGLLVRYRRPEYSLAVSIPIIEFLDGKRL